MSLGRSKSFYGNSEAPKGSQRRSPSSPLPSERWYVVHSTREKLRLLSRVAAEDATTPAALELARRAAGRVPRGADSDLAALELVSILRGLIRYAPEAPETIVRLPQLLEWGAGDCDDTSVATVAVLLRLAWPMGSLQWAIGRRSGDIDHLWVRAWIPSVRRWVDLDASSDLQAVGSDPRAVGGFLGVATYAVEL